ncbi:hypothetical protein Tco_0736903 [Tanacetum coccineum]
MALAGHHGARADGASRGVDGARNASAVVMAQPHQPRVPLPLIFLESEKGHVIQLKNINFVRDNNCIVEFDAFGFPVKDFMTRWVLLRCDSTGDLYPGLEYGRYGISKVLDTEYRGFLGVGTMFDIFQNILFPYSLNTTYCLLLDTAYCILFPSWSLVSAGTDTPYLP